MIFPGHKIGGMGFKVQGSSILVLVSGPRFYLFIVLSTQSYVHNVTNAMLPLHNMRTSKLLRHS
jgi:hypothetical protein